MWFHQALASRDYLYYRIVKPHFILHKNPKNRFYKKNLYKIFIEFKYLAHEIAQVYVFLSRENFWGSSTQVFQLLARQNVNLKKSDAQKCLFPFEESQTGCATSRWMHTRHTCFRHATFAYFVDKWESSLATRNKKGFNAHCTHFVCNCVFSPFIRERCSKFFECPFTLLQKWWNTGCFTLDKFFESIAFLKNNKKEINFFGKKNKFSMCFHIFFAASLKRYKRVYRAMTMQQPVSHSFGKVSVRQIIWFIFSSTIASW